mmetsp:Transcript_14237/g.19950  ORF Transcript_14237/g.19950 Transcript_14237/m.19950 type:complete len:150 (-) Transcript_14237:21-470(-)
MDEQTADYESARDADRIQMNEEIERANDVAQVCEERVKEMEDLVVKMKKEFEEEKKRAVDEAVKVAVKKLEEEHQLQSQQLQQKQEQEQQVERTPERPKGKERYVFDGMPPQHKAPETDKYAIPSKIGTNCDDAGEEQICDTFQDRHQL